MSTQRELGGSSLESLINLNNMYLEAEVIITTLTTDSELSPGLLQAAAESVHEFNRR